MGKRPNGTPGKKLPAPSASKQPAGPMTLGNMRSLGPRMRCTKCGHLGASVRPDWTQLRGVPGKPPR